MSAVPITRLADGEVLKGCIAAHARERQLTAEVLAYLAEIDRRRLYLSEGYSSLFVWCVEVLGLSEQSAFKRIRVARASQAIPGLCPAIADGRLNLSTATLLAPHLTTGNAEELIAAVVRKRREDVEKLLAERFPQPDVPTLIMPIAAAAPAPNRTAPAVQSDETKLSPGRVEPAALAAAPIRIAALSPKRYLWQLTATQEMQDDLQRARELLGHAIPNGDVAQVLARALRLLVCREEGRKFAGTERPRRGRASKQARHIAANIRRAVWQRDGGRCTFVGENGRRCESRARLEFDHVEPVARSGQTTAANLRLRCRAHNQYEAERRFGKGFMEAKRRSTA